MKRRSLIQEIADGITLPFRVLALIERDRFGLSSIASDRYYYVAQEVIGFCLDVGCGKHDRFIKEFIAGHGKGIDVHPWDGLGEHQVVENLDQFPFPDKAFDTVTFIANLNHIRSSKRDIELGEAYRCLRDGGNIIVTMGHPLAEILGHKLIEYYDRLLGTRYDMDNDRGMHDEESLYLHDREIRERLNRAGFKEIKRKRFLSQWGLNALYVGWKREGAFDV